MTANIITFNSPAAKWEEASLLGNGRLGAMIFGSPDREKIQLNEDSIWPGQYRDRNNPCARNALPDVRRLLEEGRAVVSRHQYRFSGSGLFCRLHVQYR